VALSDKDTLATTGHPGGPNLNDAAEKLLTEQFHHSWGYQQHVESQMVAHLRFYVTLLLGLGSVAIAILQFGRASTLPIVGLVGLLFLVFWFAGEALRRVYVELRIRKMKAIEDLNSIREYFGGRSSIVSKYSAFPVRRVESPPFLRKGCAEWYSLIFMALMNSLSLTVFLCLAIYQWVYPGIASWWPVFLVLITVPCFLFEFRSFTLQCYKYDLKRSQQLGESSKYDLLELKDRSKIENTLRRLGEYFEECYRRSLDTPEKRNPQKEK